MNPRPPPASPPPSPNLAPHSPRFPPSTSPAVAAPPAQTPGGGMGGGSSRLSGCAGRYVRVHARVWVYRRKLSASFRSTDGGKRIFVGGRWALEGACLPPFSRGRKKGVHKSNGEGGGRPRLSVTGVGGSGMAAWTPPPDPPPPQPTSLCPSRENEIYQRGPKWELDVRYANRFFGL